MFGDQINQLKANPRSVLLRRTSLWGFLVRGGLLVEEAALSSFYRGIKLTGHGKNERSSINGQTIH